MQAFATLLDNGLALAAAAVPPSLLVSAGQLGAYGLRAAVARASTIAVTSLGMTDAKDEGGLAISTVRSLLSFVLFPGLFLRLPSSLLGASPTLVDPYSFNQVDQIDVVVHGIVYVILARVACQALEKYRLRDRFVFQLRSAEDDGTNAGFARLVSKDANVTSAGNDAGSGSPLRWEAVDDKNMATVLTGRRQQGAWWKLAVNDNTLQSFGGVLRFAPVSAKNDEDLAGNGTDFSVGNDSLYVASWGRNELADTEPMQETEHRGGEVHFCARDSRMCMIPRTPACRHFYPKCSFPYLHYHKVVAVPL